MLPIHVLYIDNEFPIPTKNDSQFLSSGGEGREKEVLELNIHSEFEVSSSRLWIAMISPQVSFLILSDKPFKLYSGQKLI